MRTLLLAAGILAMAGSVHAQSPTGTLPSEAQLPANPSTSSAPNPGNDEVSARRRLEDQGYRDLRNVTPNGDGTFSAQGTHENRDTLRPGRPRETTVDIDASGRVRER